MKTLTEFFGMNLKQAAQTRKALIDSGKTPDELTAALGETLKLEGDRLNHLVQALEAVGNQLQDLKRVVVFRIQEGEKAPQKGVQKGEYYYLVEYYPSLEKPKTKKSFDQSEKGDKKGRKNKGRGRRGRDQGNRRPDQLTAGEGQKIESSEGGESRRRRPRRFPKRTPHPEQQARVTTGRIIPRAEILAQEAAAAAAAQGSAPAQDSTQVSHTAPETQA
jgi:hypothetical protein